MSKDSSYKKAAREEGSMTTLGFLKYIHQNPDMFLSSIATSARAVVTLTEDYEPRKVVTKISPALEQFFDEVFSNACDAMDVTNRNGFETGPIIVSYGNPLISVKNEGFPMLVEQDENGIWKPTKAVTEPMTSTKFKERRNGGGKNGIGLKAIWAYCMYMKLEIFDSVNGKYFVQEWDGPTVTEGPIVEDYDGELSSVEVSYIPNFEELGYDWEDYPDEMTDIIREKSALGSLSCKTQVMFNDEVLDYTNIIKYSNIHYDEDAKRVVHYVWPKGTKVVNNKDGTQDAKDGITLPLVELIYVDTIKSGKKFGVTNAVPNKENGIHVDGAYEAIVSKLLSNINGTVKGGDKNPLTVKMEEIKMHIGVIILVRVTNPLFDGQSKDKLASYSLPDDLKKQVTELKIVLHKDKFEELLEFDCITYMKDVIDGKVSKMLQSTDGSKTRKLKREINGSDAGDAGGKDSQKCILLIFEGKSAGMYGNQFRDLYENGMNRIGILFTGGKIPNINRGNIDSLVKMNKNQFFGDFKAMMGIKEEVDYNIPANQKKLRYSLALYAGDADVDGIHICGLFLNMVNTMYPSLLEGGLISTYRTKIFSAINKKNKKQRYHFYQISEFKEWAQGKNLSNWIIKYYKGLGSSNKVSIKEDFEKMFVVDINRDDEADETMAIYFGPAKENTDLRKQLIEDYDAESVPPPILDCSESITEYLQNYMRSYFAHTLHRHLYRRDGFNVVRRKILHAATKKWNWWDREMSEETEAFTVVFNGFVLEQTNYHHGESLTGVIVRMCQMYCGCGNNISYLTGNGQFGERIDGGDEWAGARYTHLYPTGWWCRRMFNKKDRCLTKYKKDGNVEIEPEVYFTLLPGHLVNGLNCVLSGWRCYFPPFNIIDLCDWYIAALEEREDIPTPTPWYRGFRGKVSVMNTKKMVEKEFNLCDDEGEPIVDDYGEVQYVTETSMTGRYSVVTEGIIDDIEGYDCTVYELPVGCWTLTFQKNLDKMVADGKLTSWHHLPEHTTDNIAIRLIGVVPKNPGKGYLRHGDFPLVKSYPLSLMIILDDNDKVKHFESIDDALWDFVEWRLPYYEKRRLIELEQCEKTMKLAKQRIEFIRAVIDGKLVLYQGNGKTKKRDLIRKEATALGLNPDLYGNVKYYDDEAVTKYQEEYDIALRKYKKRKTTTASKMWIHELEKGRTAYINEYGNDNE